MKTQHILLDLDDTLIHCNRHFTLTREKFLDHMMVLFQDYPIDRDLVDKTQQQIDVAGVEQKGLGKNRFPESLVQTYRLMCGKYGKTPNKQEEKEIFQLGHSVYDFEVELYPDALSTIEQLIRQGHELYLYTGGDFKIQTQKVLNAGLDGIFPEERRFICEHKNTLILKKILRRENLDPSHTWMVGNSARNDIRPALELGLHAIHIPDAYGWEYDHVELDIPAKGHFHVLKSIREVPDVIAESLKGDHTRRENLG
ncbi:HAD family hydrolase [Effusibacillus consociatus]|uniref:HAD family hydrolase n=1 Tax=Effusibacillus consociatus TaxID=1117041 RepID=A0ABV9Q822_9BACL